MPTDLNLPASPSVGLRINHTLVNPVVRGILRSPLHRLLSGSLMLVTFTGRRSGRRRTNPVGYARDGEALIVLVGWPERKSWWRNLRGGAPVTVVVRGRPLAGRAEVVTGADDPARAAALLEVYRRRFPRAGEDLDPGDAVLVRIEPAAGA